MYNNRLLKYSAVISVLLSILLPASCSQTRHKEENGIDGLTETLKDIIKDKPGQIGIAVIIDNSDTVKVNNSDDYPLMSMFKLHEAIAVCRTLDKSMTSIDSTMQINRAALDHDTWSPMLADHTSPEFSLSVKELIDYILIHSDNNASNILFDNIVSVAETDSITGLLLPDNEVRLMYMERQMKEKNDLAYENRCSPLSYAILVNKVFTDSVASADKQAVIRQAMLNCNTGLTRLAAPLNGKEGVSFAHRTGTGYVTPENLIVAINDGGYVRLPSGKGYSIAVFIKDYNGKAEEAESIMASISAAVYDRLSARL